MQTVKEYLKIPESIRLTIMSQFSHPWSTSKLTWHDSFEVLNVLLSCCLFLKPSIYICLGTANMKVGGAVQGKKGESGGEKRRRTEDIWNATIVTEILRGIGSEPPTEAEHAGFYSGYACCSTTTIPPVRSGPAAAPIEEPLWSDFLWVASATGVDRTGLRFDWCGKNWLDSRSSNGRGSWKEEGWANESFRRERSEGGIVRR